MLVSFLSVAFASGADENVADEKVIESLIQNMGHQDVSVRVDAVNGLVEIGEPAVDPLINALKNKNPKIRENSASALGKMGDERAVEPLIQMLGGIAGVDAAAALSDIGEPAVNPLINVLPDDDPHVRAYAARALGGTGDVHAVEPVIELLNDEDENVRSNAVMALGDLGDERAIGPLTKALTDKSERVRSLARSAIDDIESQDNYGVIATYGKEREFYTEDERRNWLDELEIIGSGLGNDMQKYMHPDGPVISYGYGYDGYISVTFLEGSEINDSLMDEIYGVVDQRAVQYNIQDVPVEFEFEGMPVADEGVADALPSPEEYDICVLDDDGNVITYTRDEAYLDEDGNLVIIGNETTQEEPGTNKQTPGFTSMMLTIGLLLAAMSRK